MTHETRSGAVCALVLWFWVHNLRICTKTSTVANRAMRSPRPVQTAASWMGTENGVLFRGPLYSIPANVAAATDWPSAGSTRALRVSLLRVGRFKCAVGAPRYARRDASRSIADACCAAGGSVARARRRMLSSHFRCRSASMSDSAIMRYLTRANRNSEIPLSVQFDCGYHRVNINPHPASSERN